MRQEPGAARDDTDGDAPAETRADTRRVWAWFVVVAVLLWLVQAVPPTLVALATGDATYGGPFALAGLVLRTPSWILACVGFACVWTETPTLAPWLRSGVSVLGYLLVGVVVDGIVWGFDPGFAAAEAAYVGLRGGQLWAGVLVGVVLALLTRRSGRSRAA